MANENVDRGTFLLAEAEAMKKSSNSWMNYLLGNTSLKATEAANMYVRAANAFRLAKKFQEAGQAFLDAASLREERIFDCERTRILIQAAKCFRHTNAEACIEAFGKGIKDYCEMGLFAAAAIEMESLAMCYENDFYNITKAIETYEQAASYFELEEHMGKADQMLLKVATLSVEVEDYAKAIPIFEQLAMSSKPDSETAAKYFLFLALVCHACVSRANVSVALRQYSTMLPSFSDSKESKLVQTFCTTLDGQNREKFLEAVEECKNMFMNDPLIITFLNRLEKHANF